MSIVVLPIGVVLVASGSGCAEPVFSCATSEQCVRGSEQGFCQPTHHCSFTDQDCSSGQRYVDDAPAGLAGSCASGDLVSDLALRFGLDEGAGDIAADSSGNEFDGSIEGGPSWVDGVWRSALEFDRTEERVYADAAAMDFGMSSFSGFAWVKTTDLDSSQARVFGHQYEVGWVWLSVGTSGAMLDARDSADVDRDIAPSDSGVSDDRWHHIGFVFDQDGDVGRFYVDGVQVEETSFAGLDGSFSRASEPEPMAVAAQSVGNEGLSLDGTLDEIWIFRRAVGDDEVQALFEGPALAADDR